MKKIILYILLSIAFHSSNAQNVSINNFDAYHTREGLSNNYITGAVQDSFGFIWIGTKKGLNRYDGNNFLQFYADSSSNSLPQDEITRIKMLPANRLACLTTSGLYLINTKTLEGKTLLIPADSLKFSYKVNAVMDVEGDAEGNIFLLTRSGFYAVNAAGKIWYRYDYYSSTDVEEKPFAFGVTLIKVNNLYVLSTEAGDLLFDPVKKILAPLSRSKDSFLLSIHDPVLSIRTIYKNENIFVNLKTGLNNLEFFDILLRKKYAVQLSSAERNMFDWRSAMFRLDESLYAICGKENGFYFIRYSRKKQAYFFDSTLNFKGFYCKAVFKDRQGNLWVGTKNGIFRENNIKSLVEKIILPAGSHPPLGTLSMRMVAIADNKIFAGSTAGIFVYDQPTGKFLKHIDLTSISPGSNVITSLLPLNNNTILVAGVGPLISLNAHNFSFHTVALPGWDKFSWIATLHQDRQGNIFASSNKEGSFYLLKKKYPEFSFEDHRNNPLFKILLPFNIASDYSNNIWFAGNGLSRYNISTGSFDLMLNSFPKIKTERKEVLSLVFDKNEKLYLGLAENGLVIYDLFTKKFKLLSRSDGLPDNNVLALYLLNNILWIGTASGIATLNTETNKLLAYNIANDIPDENFTGFNFYYDSMHNQMYAPFNNTILRFNPNSLKKNNTAPVFFIENIHINQQKIIYHPQGKISLLPGENNLLINLASINFEDARQQQYFYKIENSRNNTWQSLGNQKSFILNNLSSGTHEIKFMISSKNNSWPARVFSLTVLLKPPFWRSGWFIIVAGIVLLSAIFFLYKARVNRIRQKANIDKQLAELEMKSLHAQMNPHFIFNALNSIKEMIWENDKHNASRYLSKFAQLIRTTLEQSRQPFITVNQCIQHLEQYLQMEQIRFDEFKHVINKDENTDWSKIRMAPMLVQPLVENAIWHGLKNSDTEKLLEISFYLEPKHVICEIADNGPGIDSIKSKNTNTTHQSIGIANIHNRLQVLNEKYNMNCSLNFIDKNTIDKNSHGTVAILKLSI